MVIMVRSVLRMSGAREGERGSGSGRDTPPVWERTCPNRRNSVNGGPDAARVPVTLMPRSIARPQSGPVWAYQRTVLSRPVTPRFTPHRPGRLARLPTEAFGARADPQRNISNPTHKLREMTRGAGRALLPHHFQHGRMSRGGNGVPSKRERPSERRPLDERPSVAASVGGAPASACLRRVVRRTAPMTKPSMTRAPLPGRLLVFIPSGPRKKVRVFQQPHCAETLHPSSTVWSATLRVYLERYGPPSGVLDREAKPLSELLAAEAPAGHARNTGRRTPGVVT